MEQVATQGEGLWHDAPAVRLVALLQEHSALLAAAQAPGVSTPTERTGRHTMALVVQVGAPTAILAYSSRRQAGETLQGLLAKRAAGLTRPLARADALTSHAVADEARLRRCHCLAQGRRTCSALADVCPQECQGVLEVIRQGCDHDKQARQAQSQPLMDGLKRWRATQRDEHLGAPRCLPLQSARLSGALRMPRGPEGPPWRRGRHNSIP